MRSSLTSNISLTPPLTLSSIPVIRPNPSRRTTGFPRRRRSVECSKSHPEDCFIPPHFPRQECVHFPAGCCFVFVDLGVFGSSAEIASVWALDVEGGEALWVWSAVQGEELSGGGGGFRA